MHKQMILMAIHSTNIFPLTGDRKFLSAGPQRLLRHAPWRLDMEDGHMCGYMEFDVDWNEQYGD